MVFSIRSTLEIPKVRKQVLELLTKNSDLTFKDLGLVVGGPKYKKELKEVADKVVEGKKDIYVFSLQNQHDEKFETHFQSVIVKTNPREVIWFDPSMSRRGNPGIYEPHAGLEFEQIMKKKKPKYRIRRNPVTETCQLVYTDVFCQSWSLYLQYMYLKDNILKNSSKSANRVKIDEDYSDKARVLLSFYKKICKEVESFGKKLEKEYKANLNHYSKEEEYEELKEVKRQIKDVDVCDVVRKLRVKDLFNEEIEGEETSSDEEEDATDSE